GSAAAPFLGHLEGSNYTISNLVINIAADNIGLFGVAGSGSSFTNIKFDSCSITGNNNVACLVGSIIMSAGTHDWCVITNVDATNCYVHANTNLAGTIVGQTITSAYTRISFCDVSQGTVTTGSNHCGGLMGSGAYSASVVEMNDCTVTNCVITTGSYHCGGLMGYGATSASDCTVTACTVTNCVITTGSYNCGGLMGYGAYSASDCTVTACTVTNCVITTGSNSCGGLMGAGANSASVTVTECTVTECTVYGTSGTAGGLIGYGEGTSTTHVDGCNVVDTTVLGSSTAGLVQTVSGTTTITNCDVSHVNVQSGVVFAPAGSYTAASCTSDGITSVAGRYIYATVLTTDVSSYYHGLVTYAVNQQGSAVLAADVGYGTKSGKYWTYGDGVVDYSDDLTHMFTTSGTYVSSLKLANMRDTTGITLTTTSFSILLASPVVTNASVTPTLIVSGDNVTFTANVTLGQVLKWEVLSGSTWTSIGDATTLDTALLNYTITELSGVYQYRLNASNNLGVTYGDTVNLTVIGENIAPIITASGISTSDTDEYTMPIRIQWASDVVESFTISSEYGIVITKNSLHFVHMTENNLLLNDTVSDTVYYDDRFITGADYLSGYLIYTTSDNKAYSVPVLTTTNEFGAEVELIGFSGIISDIDVSLFHYLVGCEGTGAYVFSLTGGILEDTIVDTVSTNFVLSKSTTDGGLQYVVFCVNDNNKLRAYKTNVAYEEVSISQTLINGIATATDATTLIVTTNANTAIVPYVLSATTFAFGTPIYANDARALTSVDTISSGLRFAGVNESNILITSSTGALTGLYPTASILNNIEIAKSTGLIAVASSSNGQLFIIKSSGTAWSGLQSFFIRGDVSSLATSNEGYLIATSTGAFSYFALHTGGQNVDDNVLTTKYYLKVTVYDAYGAVMPDAQVTITSPSAANTYVTDYLGTITVEVVPTYAYLIALPNDAATINYVADNYALQYVAISYPASNFYYGINYNASFNTNRYIDMTFTDSQLRDFDIIFNIYNSDNVLIQNYNATAASLSQIYDTTLNVSEDYIVVLSAEYNDEIVTKSWVFSVKNYYDTTNQTGLILGDVPLIPIDLDQNWVSFFFCGFIMIIGGMFGYAHATKGFIAIVVSASVLTYLEVLPLNPIWVGCIVILGILGVYSYVSQTDGN
ncbi:MAG: hypothetical protein M0R51_14985, partial [Clostridia bacterium]|nr:hypothetical protein [Clostridia bacterium]